MKKSPPEIPEAGRERDKLIAELKGIEPVYACYADDPAGDGYCVLDNNNPFNCLICEREEITNKFECKEWAIRPDYEWIPLWSTSRNDAWELWDELPLDRMYRENLIEGVLRYIVSVNWKHDNPESLYKPALIIVDDSFPDAVSKTWIIWKQSQ